MPITYANKDNTQPNTDPRKLWRDVDGNEIKNVVNTDPFKLAVRVATVANGTLASAFQNGSVVNGVTLSTDDRILIKDQTSQAENGIYTVNTSGAPTRAIDADATDKLNGALVWVRQGTVNSKTLWKQTTDAPTVGSSNIVWTLMDMTIASQSENNTGTDDTKVLTPLKLKNLDRDVVGLVDAASIDITGPKHSLTTNRATITWTISFVGDEFMIEVTLNATSAIYTFFAGSLCVTDGLSSGDNTLPISGVSGDKYVIVGKKVAGAYYIVSKNFGQ